jgi:hypothetical protein
MHNQDNLGIYYQLNIDQFDYDVILDLCLENDLAFIYIYYIPTWIVKSQSRSKVNITSSSSRSSTQAWSAARYVGARSWSGNTRSVNGTIIWSRSRTMSSSVASSWAGVIYLHNY